MSAKPITLNHLQEGESTVVYITVNGPSYVPFTIRLPNEWVKEHTAKEARAVVMSWVGDHLEVRGIT